MENMARHNSTLINELEIKSITSERLSPIPSKTISSSDDENDYDEEIPIYISGVPRYISGINRKTTCNDIIKALIDDELANTKVSKQLICEPEKYTIYERFQDIEHGLSGSELIYDLWQNWGAHKSQVQFRLKINKQLELSEDRLKLNKIKNSGIRKLLKNVLVQGEMIQKHLKTINEMHHKKDQIRDFYFSDSDNEFKLKKRSIHEMQQKNESTDSEDELFLVIENQNDNDSGVFITKEAAKETFNFDNETLQETPKRRFKHDSMKDCISNKEYTLNEDNEFVRASFKFNTVHQEIKIKIDELNHKLQLEQSFLQKINDKNENENLIVDSEFCKPSEFCDNNETIIV